MSDIPLNNPATIFYNGNPNIIKAGIKQNFTEHQLKEYIRCRDDILYFIKNYVKIVTLDFGTQLFSPYEYQERMIDKFDKHRFVINLLPRQTGKTTIVSAFILHYAIFTPEKSTGILANKEKNAVKILGQIKRMYEKLPHFLQPGVKEYNKGNVVFGNDSEILAFATGSDAVRGFSFNFVYLDEFAFVDNADEFWASTYPVISSGKTTKVVITSTPNGMNLFYKLWMDSKMERNSFANIEVKWQEHPDRDEAWAQETLNNIGQHKFDQEYNCKFYGSSTTLVSGEALASLVWNEPIESDGDTVIFEKPSADHSYVVSVDVGDGVGLDNSVINVTKLEDGKFTQVAVWKNNTISPMILPEYVHKFAEEYNEAWILIEVNSIGSQTANILYHDYEYENMIITKQKKNESVVSGGFSRAIDLGVRMTKKSKMVGCSNIKTLIENHVYVVQDFSTISELETFSRKGSSYEAEQGKKDDIVMTLVSFGWLTTQDYFIDLIGSDAKKTIREKRLKESEDELLPAGFFNDAVEELEIMENYDSTIF